MFFLLHSLLVEQEMPERPWLCMVQLKSPVRSGMDASCFSWESLRYLCWGIHLVLVTWLQVELWVAEAQGKRQPGTDPLENKWDKDLWHCQVTRHSETQQQPMTPDFGTLRLWGYKNPGLPLVGAPPQRKELKLLFCLWILIRLF